MDQLDTILSVALDLTGALNTNFDANFVNGGGGTLTVIPEPGTLALLATGLIGLLCYAWRKRK